ncbi:MAG TPA: thiamine pyrophosphate-dependent enzyme, partial [Acidimicrobiales bacterium]|nr:thiamine pyrophosphate-dependent enzyme [Acidimicrobiales bacterium]
MKPGVRVADAEVLRSMFVCMARTVACDEALRDAIGAGQITISYYSPRGQEAVAAGMGAALGPRDYLVTTYRGLHDQIAKGVPLRPLLAEMLGKREGTGKGKGGPMHVVWPESGLMLTTGVVGSGLPVACGLAWEAQRSPEPSEPRVALVSFGDGATNIGSFHEACNLASLWELPLVFLCQNNRYGEHTAIARHQRNRSVADRAVSYSMPGVTVDGNDPVAVFEAVSEATARARSGGGPTLVEAVTYRLYGHVFGDRMTYLDPSELDAAWREEPVARFRARLIEEGVLDDEQARQTETDAAAECSRALAEVMPLPEPGPDELLADVVGPVSSQSGSTASPLWTKAKTTIQRGRSSEGETSSRDESGEAEKPVSVRQAINRALDISLSGDDRVVLLGEDISDAAGGGVFGVTRGLSTAHGEDRVRDTPISEQAIVGAAVGAALGGLRPIAEVMFMDFLA